jgi:LPXTG-motif cell wall-anchored protein
MAFSEDSFLTGFADELVKEATGKSSKPWALVFATLLIVGLGALWFVRRRHAEGADAAEEVPAPVAA